MNDVFISYSRRDKVFTQKLYEALKAQSREIWADWEDIPPGSDWFAEIKQGIEESQSVLFVLSPEWIKSNECRKEMDYAVKMGKRLVPVIWQNIDPKDAPPELAKINWIFMREGDDFDKGFQLVSTTLDTDLDWIKSHTRLQTRALEWDKKNKDRSFVLRGKDLEDAEQFLSHGSHKDPEPTPLQGDYILISRKEAVRVQRMILSGVIAALVISVFLAIVAAFQWQAANVAKATAVVERDRAVVAQQTAVSAQETAVSAQAVAVEQRDRAVSAEATAVAELARSESLRMVAEANTILADPLGNPEVAALLSLKALQNDYYPEADTALTESLSHLYSIGLIKYGYQTKGEATQSVSVAITPDGKAIAIASMENFGRVELFNSADGKLIRSMGTDSWVRDIAISPDGKLLASASDAGATLFDLGSGRKISDFTEHTDIVEAIAFSPDGKYLLTGSWDDTARLWDISSGDTVMTFYGHADNVLSVAFAPDGRSVYTSSWDQTARRWDINTGSVLGEVQEYNLISDIAVSKDGNWFATTTDRKATVWSATDFYTLYDARRHQNWVQSVAFSPDSQYYVTGGDDNIARIWETQTGELKRVLVGHTGKITGVEYSPDGSYVITASVDGTVRLWNADVAHQNGILLGHAGTVTDVAVSPDGKTIVSGSMDENEAMDNNYKVWNIQTGKQIGALIGHSWFSSSTSFSADGRYILTSNGDGSVGIWDANTYKLVRMIQVTGGAWVDDAVFSPDGKYILAGSDENSATLWETATGKKLLTLDYPDQVRSVAYSPDGKFAVTSCRDNIIRLWDLSTGNEVREFTGHTQPLEGYLTIESITFSPDGKYILSGSVDGSARWWDVATGRLVKLFDHGSPVFSAALSRDGKYVLTGGSDRMARLWDVETGTLLRTFAGHKDAVFAVAFSPDGKFVVTASADKTIRIWDTNYQDTIELACSLLVRDLSSAERTAHGIKDTNPICPK